MNIPYFSLIERLQSIKKHHYFGVTMRNGIVEAIKVYFLIPKEEYIEIYTEHFLENPVVEELILPLNKGVTYKDSLYKHPCISIKINLQGKDPSVCFYHLDRAEEDSISVKSIDTLQASEKQYVYKYYYHLTDMEKQLSYISLDSIDIPETTCIATCYSKTGVKVQFIPQVEIPYCYSKENEPIISSIRNDYCVVGNSIGPNGYVSYYFMMFHPSHIVEQIYDIYHLLHPLKKFICPITWDYSSIILKNLSKIRSEFKIFQNQDTPFLTKDRSYITPTEKAVEWIKDSDVLCTRQTPYPTYIGYEKTLCAGIWTFLPIYYKQSFYFENEFPNTIQLLKNIKGLHMAGFMVLKNHKEIEWHKHQTDHTIFHFNITDQEISKDDISIMLTGITDIQNNHVPNEAIEKIQIGTYGSCCMFHTNTYHHTINRSPYDRTSFVVELDYIID